MSQSCDQSKHQKTLHTSSYRDIVPSLDPYTTIHSSEAFRTLPPETFAQQSDSAWMGTSSWQVLDDPNFALDPDSNWYDEAVEGDVMDETSKNTEVPIAAATRKAKSKRSVSPNVIFIESTI